MNKFGSISAIILLGLIVSLTEAGHVKRSVIVASPVGIAAPVVASPVAVRSHVVHTNPTTVVKTEQVHSGDHASYSYSSEVRSHPAVVHQTVSAAAPVVHTAAAVATVPVVHHTVPTYAYSYYSPLGYYYYLRK